jgi:hypothetical protein
MSPARQARHTLNTVAALELYKSFLAAVRNLCIKHSFLGLFQRALRFPRCLRTDEFDFYLMTFASLWGDDHELKNDATGLSCSCDSLVHAI